MRLIKIFAVILLGFLSQVYAQDTIPYTVYKAQRVETPAQQPTTNPTPAPATATIDSVRPLAYKRDVPQTSLPTTIQDSLNTGQQDEPTAQRLDNAWRRELARMDLYDSIQNMVRYPYYNETVNTVLPTDTLKKRLAILDAKTPFDVNYNPALESVINRYLKRHKPTMERLMGISKFYFPLFEENLDRHNIPLELKYLAIVESGLRPKAKSRVGATGLWQFMFTTGKMYGLEVNSYVDERMDPIRATEAACEYLSKLYELFDDWDLALASYNSGPGNVSKAIRRSGGYTNYWNIRQNLPRETAGYVPAFLATMYLFEYAEEHRYQPEQPPVSYFASDTIRVKKTITLDQISRFTGASLETLQFLNPSYKLDVIPVVDGKDYYLRLPLESVGRFVNNEDAIYAFAKAELDKREKPLPEFTKSNAQIRYKVKSGDYLGKIASRYGVKVSQIKRWNNMRSNNLKIGQRLTIYPRKPVDAAVTSKPKEKAIPKGSTTYTVQQGDSLWGIANKFPGVSIENIRLWNDISGNKLKPGMVLVVGK